MRAVWVACFLAASAVVAPAERHPLRPTDFEPLTEFPWSRKEIGLEEVLEAIFREPNSHIRYRVLAEYLRQIPAAQLDRAFDVCLRLEGTQTPNELVEFFLPIWAQRDPAGCWKRARELFRVVGIEDGWLNYDSWKKRRRLSVQDLDAIRASPFWLERSALASFPVGVDRSKLPEEERVRILREFAETWLAAFKSWPEPSRPEARYSDDGHHTIQVFRHPAHHVRQGSSGSTGADAEAAFEVGLRRWLVAQPSAAPDVMKRAGEMRSPGPSPELLLLWSRADLPGMTRWVESLDLRDDPVARLAKGLLMSRTDAATRERWLAEARAAGKEDDLTISLFEAWASWDPAAALPAAVATKSSGNIQAVIGSLVGGPWRNALYNTWHSGLEVAKAFDVMTIPENIREEATEGWSQHVMEAWGSVDAAAAARYGLDFMLRTGYAPREGLIRFFSGEDLYPDEGGMIDRTFCAMRVWAVVKPHEMKAWIATIQDAEMRRALTWLCEHPWGTGPKEYPRAGD